MAKPRKFVNRNGQPTQLVTGISKHTRSGRFYILTPKGQRRYFATWDEAQANLNGQESRDETAVLMTIKADLFDDGPRPDERLPFGYPLDELDENDPHYGWFMDEQAGREHLMDRYVPADEFWSVVRSKYEADPELFCKRVGIDLAKPEVPAPADCVTMKEIGRRWREHAEQRHTGATRHITETMRRWDEFTNKVDNPSISELTPETFRKYYAYVETAGHNQSAKWGADRAATVRSLLRWGSRRYPEWKISQEVIAWASLYNNRKYKPKADNRKPITPAEFSAMLNACAEWQQIDVDNMPTATDAERGQKLQAMKRRRTGYQLEAILRLALNAALDNVDIERIEWTDLKLDDKRPHMNFARRKMERLVGQPVERITPMLPTTVDALKRWQKIEGRTTGSVFSSGVKSPLNRAMLARLFKSAKTAAGLSGGLTFKHLRNAAPTIAHKKFKSRDLADMILGHQLPTTARFYVGDLDSPEPLVELVKAVGDAYGC